MNIINSSIFFAEWWRTKDDKPVDCFTTITIEDLENGTYKPANPEHFEQARNYLKQIKEKTPWPFTTYQKPKD